MTFPTSDAPPPETMGAAPHYPTLHFPSPFAVVDGRYPDCCDQVAYGSVAWNPFRRRVECQACGAIWGPLVEEGGAQR